ncbi:hypothetical protein [Lunatibacter salilacus]|uniref:hypothetical protein n=1 Tax=Lunatibacter salilacus TaxID=2483804 RepID=UPI00131ED089|nr:hypothetical protein [Lunatibacter salilacus]
MKNFLPSSTAQSTKNPSSVRFPHPFAYHFEKNSSLGITTGTKYFRGQRVRKKSEVPGNNVSVDPSINKNG